MATIQSQLVCDSSTFANFSQWASPISTAFATFGWAQSTDTGQIMWTGLSISAVSMSGTAATYTYSGLTGLALVVGRTLTITGMGNSVNNGTFNITALGSGTFTVTNASGVNASTQTGAVTKASSVPGSGAFVYEVWTPNDSLANFFAKVEYGNISGTNTPSLRVTLSTTTDGAGTPTGFVSQACSTNFNTFTIPSTTTQYECDFSGSAGRFGAMMWRNGINTCQQIFVIERSLNSSGVYTAAYATVVTGGHANNTPQFTGQSLVFAVGAAPLTSLGNDGSVWALPIRVTGKVGVTTAFNGSIPFDTYTPMIGYFDYPMTMIGTGQGLDFAEGVTFSATLYGTVHTFMPGKTGPFDAFGPKGDTNFCTCMRYD